MVTAVMWSSDRGSVSDEVECDVSRHDKVVEVVE